MKKILWINPVGWYELLILLQQPFRRNLKKC
ncbi:MAG: hypothetical protein PWQ60_164 [Thermoanaerobacteraceae bacterium]|jgi:hypothetical protein|nr:hypothetical protein [Thermoanaerobacteraceae bacterium]